MLWTAHLNLTWVCPRYISFVVSSSWFPRENSHWDLLGTWTGKYSCLFLPSLQHFHPGKLGCCNGNPRFMFSLNPMSNLILSVSTYVSPRYQTLSLNNTPQNFFKRCYCLFPLQQFSSDLKSCDSREIWSICFWFIYWLTDDCKNGFEMTKFSTKSQGHYYYIQTSNGSCERFG